MSCCKDNLESPPWYFCDEARQKALLVELNSWTGTRFFPNMCKKGIGVDCIQFVSQVLINTGAMQPFDFPRYAWRSGGAAMLALLRRGVNERHELFPIWTGPGSATGWPPLLPGDGFICSNGVANHHASIYAGDNTVWHVLMNRGVCQANVTDPGFVSLVQNIYRPSTLPKPTLI